MLALFIPGKKSMKNHNIDMYLAPLLEELQLIWKGVYAWAAKVQTARPTYEGKIMNCLHMDYF
jgi:hypothetical protein